MAKNKSYLDSVQSAERSLSTTKYQKQP